MASSSSSSCSSSSSRRKAARRSSGSPIECSKYSRRATLRSVVGRPDGGLALAGERAVVGGWVRSSDVVVVAAKGKQRAGHAHDASPTPPPPETTGLTCTEVFMSRVPLLRCIARLIAGGVGAADQASSGRGRSAMAADETALVRINDGSCLPDLQIVVDSSLCSVEQVAAAGACVLVEGKIELVDQSRMQQQQQHVVELRVEKVLHIGAVDSEKYPLSNKNLSSSSDIVSHHPHLAARTTEVASVARVRSELIHAAHAFFRTNEFFHVNTPITTTTNAGNHSRMFGVATRLFSKPQDSGSGITPEAVRAAISAKTKQVEELKRSESNREAMEAAEQDLQRANELARQLEQQQGGGGGGDEGSGFANGGSFFHRPAYLSPCHALHLETYACALCSVYTLSPAFRAETNSEEHGRWLAEMWTIDAEIAFSELEDAVSCAEDCLKSLCSAASKHCSDELKFLQSRAEDATTDRVESALCSPWQRISYTEAIRTLLQATDKPFEAKVEWGMPLSDEHLSYLADDSYKKPVIIHGYPKQLKPFYACLQEDGKTVSAFDIVFPKVGVVACGAQKEERMDILTARIDELGLRREQLEWYLDIRRHGTVKHSGFTIDLERFVLFVTCLKDIRNVIRFPRNKGDAKC